MSKTLVFIDLETGGVADASPITQIAAIAVRDGKEIASFERKIQFDPMKNCDPESLKLNGYNAEVWAETAIPEFRALRDFNKFLDQHSTMEMISKRTGNPYYVARLAGHNIVAFDIPRLRDAMDRNNIGFWPGCWWYPLDTYQLILWHCAMGGVSKQPENFKLDTLVKFFGVQRSGAAHDALSDVRASFEISKRIMTVERA